MNKVVSPSQAFSRSTEVRVIALSGFAGSGKSTACAHLVKQGFTLVKFAGPLKDMCRSIGLTERHIEGDLKEVPCDLLSGMSPRNFMQRLGTEFGRDLVHNDFWVNLWRARVREVLEAGGKVACDDCRYLNEAAAVRAEGGVVARVVGRGGISGSHSSEAQAFAADCVIANDGSVEALHAKLDATLGVATQLGR